MISVISSNAGSDRVALDALGVVGGLRRSDAWPTGCLTASWSLDVPPATNHPAFTPGRRIELFDGLHLTWSGLLTDPDRGEPWSFSAQGTAALAADYVAVDGAGVATTNANTAVDAAITRGIPWIRRQTLPTPTLPTAAAGTLADLLNQVAAAAGMRWGVLADRTISMVADPTAVSAVIIASSTPGGRSVEEYISALYGRYSSNATVPPQPAIAGSTLNAATGGPAFGRRERLIDLTPAGPMTAAAAVTLLDLRFPLIQARAAFTGSLTVAHGDILTPGGVPLRLQSLKAGMLVRVIGAAADPHLGELLASTKLEFVVGQVDLDEDLAQITPLGAKGRDLSSLLEVAAAPDTSTEVEAAEA